MPTARTQIARPNLRSAKCTTRVHHAPCLVQRSVRPQPADAKALILRRFLGTADMERFSAGNDLQRLTLKRHWVSVASRGPAGVLKPASIPAETRQVSNFYLSLRPPSPVSLCRGTGRYSTPPPCERTGCGYSAMSSRTSRGMSVLTGRPSSFATEAQIG
jgi:hypothetical protein